MLALPRIALGLSLVLSSLILRADSLEIVPASPDSTETVTIRLSGVWPDSCPPSDPHVSIEARTIVVRYRIVNEICLSVLTPYSREIELGALPPGLYTVLALFGSESTPIAEAPLAVRSVSMPFRLFPDAASKTAGGTVLVSNTRRFCESGIPNCDRREVVFGDQSVVVEHVSDLSSEFTVVAPPQDAETVDVTIKYPDGTSATAHAAFRYFDPAAPPEPALFERILLPVTRDVRGAFGSDFRVTLSVYNDNRYSVPIWRPIGPAVSLPPASETTLRPVQPNGALVLAFRQATDGLHFSSNARDVSRVAETFGSEVRVVRENDARVGASELPNVPADPNFRLNLRLYGIDSIGGNLQVSFHSPDNRVFYGDATVPLHASSPDEPAFAMIGDLRAAFPGLQTLTSGVFRIHVQGPFGYRYWPLLTVTNNTTQQITTVTPQ